MMDKPPASYFHKMMVRDREDGLVLSRKVGMVREV